MPLTTRVNDVVLKDLQELTYYLLNQPQEYLEIARVVIKAWKDVAELSPLEEKVG